MLCIQHLKVKRRLTKTTYLDSLEILSYIGALHPGQTDSLLVYEEYSYVMVVF